MISTYNVGDSIPLAALFVDRAGGSLTGSSTMIVEIFRPADAYFLDFADTTFKASGWTTKQAALAEVSSSNAPGWYKKSSDWSTSGVAPGSYFVTYRDTSGAAGNPIQQDEIRLIDSPTAIVSGTASAASANSITLAGASATDATYKRQNVAIVGGTGAGQVRPILHYVGSTKVATVGPAWAITPDSTSRWTITPSYNVIFVDCGLAQAGGNSTVTLVSTSSSTSDLYVGCEVMILSGTGAGQTRIITAYNGSTKVATVATAWATNPDSTSVYVLLPVGRAITVSNLDKTGYGVSSVATDAISAAAVSADAVTKIQNGLATSAGLGTPEVIEVGQTETVPIVFDYVLNGTPVTGATVLFIIDRVVDGVIQRLDWDTEMFGDPAAATTPSIAMDELDATHAPGTYFRLWDSTFPNNATYPVVYFVTIKVGSTILARREIRVRTVDTINTMAARVSTILGYGAPPNAATISAQVAADLATAHGAGSWLTPDISGLATSLGLAAAVATLEGYGDAHWSTANVSALATTAQLDAHAAAIKGSGFTAGVDDLHSIRARGDSAWATPATVVLSDSSLSAAKLGAGFVNAIQANLALEATLTAMKGASFDGTTDSLRAMRVLISALPTTAAPSASDVATEVWAETEGGAEGTLRYSITLLRKRQTGRRKMGNDGYELIYDDDNVTVIKKTLVKDIEGNIVVPGAGDPAEVSQEMAP